jgi:hypothetical protein
MGTLGNWPEFDVFRYDMKPECIMRNGGFNVVAYAAYNANRAALYEKGRILLG